MISTFIGNMFFSCLVASPFYIIIRILLRIRNHSFNWLRELWSFAFFIFAVAILSQTILPSSGFHLHIERYRSVNLIPFQTINNYLGELGGPLHTIAFYNLLGNIVLFIPFGFFIPSIWKSFNSWWKMFIVAISLPVFIEGTQYFIGRSVDIDDIILNSFSILIGYGIFMLIVLFVVKTSYYRAEKVK